MSSTILIDKCFIDAVFGVGSERFSKDMIESNIKDILEKYSWLDEAYFYNFNLESNNNILVKQEFPLGIWEAGDWKGGIWNNGVWKNGTWVKGKWVNGTWKNGIWKSGEWIDGVFTKGIWDNGTWHDGIWKNGIWNKGIWMNGTHLGGKWLGGTWKDGTWMGGTWSNGTWESGMWNLSEKSWWYDGIWREGNYGMPESNEIVLFKSNYSPKVVGEIYKEYRDYDQKAEFKEYFKDVVDIAREFPRDRVGAVQDMFHLMKRHKASKKDINLTKLETFLNRIVTDIKLVRNRY